MCLKLGMGSEGVWIEYTNGNVTIIRNLHYISNTEIWDCMGCV